MLIEVIFTDGTSYAQAYQYSTEAEAMQHAWQTARLTGKAVQIIHIL